MKAVSLKDEAGEDIESIYKWGNKSSVMRLSAAALNFAVQRSFCEGTDFEWISSAKW